jgi:hypothetical protein
MMLDIHAVQAAPDVRIQMEMADIPPPSGNASHAAVYGSAPVQKGASVQNAVPLSDEPSENCHLPLAAAEP